MLDRLRRFFRDGPTAVEYAILAAGIAVVVLGIVFALGGKVGDNPRPRPAQGSR